MEIQPITPNAEVVAMYFPIIEFTCTFKITNLC